MTHQARHLSVAIEQPASTVYAFASQPQNLPLWASGLGEIRQVRGEWIVHVTNKDMRLRFAQPNEYGVLDHWLLMDDGTEIYVPLRVIANGSGCEVILTLLRQPDMPDAKFEADAEWVMRDLAALKQRMEALA